MPLFTIAIYRLYYARSYSTATYLSLIPIVAGAGLTTMGEYHYSTTGLLVTCLGVALAALKVCFYFLQFLSFTFLLIQLDCTPPQSHSIHFRPINANSEPRP